MFSMYITGVVVKEALTTVQLVHSSTVTPSTYQKYHGNSYKAETSDNAIKFDEILMY